MPLMYYPLSNFIEYTNTPKKTSGNTAFALVKFFIALFISSALCCKRHTCTVRLVRQRIKLNVSGRNRWRYLSALRYATEETRETTAREPSLFQ